MVVRRVIGPVDLGADEGADLYNHIVSSGRDGPLLDIKAVLRDPRRHYWVKVRIWFCFVSQLVFGSSNHGGRSPSSSAGIQKQTYNQILVSRV